jgi:hypothetical protein
MSPTYLSLFFCFFSPLFSIVFSDSSFNKIFKPILTFQFNKTRYIARVQFKLDQTRIMLHTSFFSLFFHSFSSFFLFYSLHFFPPLLFFCSPPSCFFCLSFPLYSFFILFFFSFLLFNFLDSRFGGYNSEK